MGAVNPAVRSESETTAHSVSVFFESKWTEKYFAMITYPIAGGISKIPDVGNAPGDAAALVIRFVPRQHAGGNVQSIGKIRDLVRFAIAVGVF